MKHRKRKGFTLVEMMFVVAFTAIVVGFCTDALVEATRIQNVAGAQYDMQRQSHHELDVMIDDIHDSQLVLSNYVAGGTTYTSDLNTTLVLQAPSYDSTGNPLGTNDIIVYYLTGQAAPYSLYRTVVPAAGSARQTENGRLIVQNVNSLTLTYLCDDDIFGDGITKVFNLYGTPSDTPTVVKNGTTETAGSQFTFTLPQTVSFGTAPAAPDALDIIYTTNPADSPSQVSTVEVDMKLQQVSNSFQDAAKTQTVEIDSKTALRNH